MQNNVTIFEKSVKILKSEELNQENKINQVKETIKKLANQDQETLEEIGIAEAINEDIIVLEIDEKQIKEDLTDISEKIIEGLTNNMGDEA